MSAADMSAAATTSLVEPGVQVLLALGPIDVPTDWIIGDVLWCGDGQFVVESGASASTMTRRCDLFCLGSLRGVRGAPLDASLPKDVGVALSGVRT